MRRPWLSLFAGLALTTAGACVQQNIRLSKDLVVASDLENPPFAAFDEAAGEAKGRDVEMMQRLCQELELNLNWNRVPFDQLIDEVESGRALLACATLGVTPERQERVLFSEPYYRTHISVVVRNDAAAPQGVDDLAGSRVAAGANTTAEQAARSSLPEAVLVPVPRSDRTLADRLLNGEVDAVILDFPNAKRLATDSAGALRLLEPPLAEEQYAIAIKKEHGYLKDRIDRALQRMREDRFFEQLDARWGL